LGLYTLKEKVFNKHLQDMFFSLIKRRTCIFYRLKKQRVIRESFKKKKLRDREEQPQQYKKVAPQQPQN